MRAASLESLTVLICSFAALIGTFIVQRGGGVSDSDAGDRCGDIGPIFKPALDDMDSRCDIRWTFRHDWTLMTKLTTVNSQGALCGQQRL